MSTVQPQVTGRRPPGRGRKDAAVAVAAEVGTPPQFEPDENAPEAEPPRTKAKRAAEKEPAAEPKRKAREPGRPRSQPESALTYSVEHAGKLLGIGRNAAYLAVQSGQLPALRFGTNWRIPRKVVDMLIEQAAKAASQQSPD